MYIHGEFANKQGQRVKVEIVTGADRTTELEIGTEEAGLWFAADDPVVVEAEVNDTFDVLLPHSCSIRLLSRQFRQEFFSASCRDAVVNVRLGGRLVFAGFIEPMAFSQPYNDALDELELSCIDAISALQYSKYKDVGAAGVLYGDVKAAAAQRTFLDILKEAITGVASGIDLSGAAPVRLLFDGSRHTGEGAEPYTIFSRLSIPELLFLGDTEDDVWGQDEVVEEMLRYLDLHIMQDGADFYVFSWQTQTANATANAGTVAWRDLIGGGDVTMLRANRTIDAAMAADCSTKLSVCELYNQLLLTCDTKGSDSLVESPLSSDSLVAVYPRRQKYMTTYTSGGEGGDAIKAYHAMLLGNSTTYDAAKKTEWYVQVKDNPGWTFYTYQGGKADILSLTSDGKHQERVPQRLGQGMGAALLSVGSRSVNVSGTDNAPTHPSMSDCLVIGAGIISSGSIVGEQEAADAYSELLKQCIPLAEYNASVAGGSLSPSDDAVTNYIVIKGKITLVPSDDIPSWADLQVGINAGSPTPGSPLDDWEKKWWHQTVNGSYVARQFWEAETPDAEPVADADGELGFYPCDGICAKRYEFRYSSIGQSTDYISKVAVLCCMLTVGGKCLVETGGDGLVEDFEWRDYKERAECASDEEYYRQSFTIGFDPKIGDKIIGTEFSIQDNNFGLGIDESGMCIPIRKADALSGDVHFQVLGLVNSMWKDTYISREPDFFHHTEWAENMVCLLGHTASVVVKDFEIKLYSDASGGTTASNDIIYMSDVAVGFVNKKDDLEFRIHSALTAEECQEMGVTNSVMLSVPVDAGTGVGALSIRDSLGREGKPEQLYVDAYYDEWHEPRLLLEQSALDADGELSPFDRYTSKALDKKFYVMGMGRNLMEGTASLKLKSLWT